MTKPARNDFRKIYRQGSVIFREGDRGDVAYLIRDGEVELRKQTLKGEIVLATVGPNALFGEMALLDGAPRMATAIARKYTVCSAIGPQQVEQRLRRLSFDQRSLFDAMLKYVRETLPWPARSADPADMRQAHLDEKIRLMLPPPGAPVPADIATDPALNAIFDVLHTYVRRRQPAQPPS